MNPFGIIAAPIILTSSVITFYQGIGDIPSVVDGLSTALSFALTWALGSDLPPRWAVLLFGVVLYLLGSSWSLLAPLKGENEHAR